MELQHWHDFFVATAGAAAALTGLIFVGVSINITRILSLPKLPDRALLSLILLLNILVISMLMLIPGQSAFLVSMELAFIAAAVYSQITKMDINIYRGTGIAYQRQYRVSLIFNQVSMLPYLVSAVTVFQCGLSGICWLVPAIIISFIKAVVDAWVLLVEINR